MSAATSSLLRPSRPEPAAVAGPSPRRTPTGVTELLRRALPHPRRDTSFTNGVNPIFSKKSLKQGVRSRFGRENRLNTRCERDFCEKIA